MKYIFRGITVFELNLDTGEVIHKTNNGMPAFDYCNMIAEDYKLLSEFFDMAYRFKNGEVIDLKDFEVY